MRGLRPGVAMAVALCAAGCTDTRTVEGSWTLRYFTEEGVVEQPRDLSAVAFEAVVGRGDQAERHEGRGFEDGRFEVEGVPDGTYLLVWRDVSVIGSSLAGSVEDSRMPLTYDTSIVGRPDRLRPGQSLEIAVSLEGLSPWQYRDELHLTSPAVGLRADLFDVARVATAGATALSAELLWWDYLVEAGDTTYLTQLAAKDAPVAYQAVDRVAITSELDLSSADPTPWNLFLEPANPGYTLSIDGDLFALGDAVRSTHPLATLPRIALAVEAQPRWVDHGVEDTAAVLLRYEGQGLGEIHADLAYGDPYPSEWDRFVTWSARAPLTIDEPDVARPAALDGGVGRATLRAQDAVTMQPLVTPPLSLRIDGADATTALAAVGTGPHVSWDAPFIGDPTTYVISVFVLTHHVEGDVLVGDLTRIASLQTRETSLDLPPDLLDPRGRYILRVTAWAGTPADHGWAAALSSPFTP